MTDQNILLQENALDIDIKAQLRGYVESELCNAAANHRVLQGEIVSTKGLPLLAVKERMDDAAADRIAALEKQIAELLAALQELVDLKMFKDRWEANPHMHHVYWMKGGYDDYQKRKPIAWERASALVQPSTQEVSK